MSREEISDFVDARKQIYEAIKSEIIGPGSEDVGPELEYEVITDDPIKRYVSGMLFPQNEIRDHIDGEEVIESQEAQETEEQQIEQLKEQINNELSDLIDNKKNLTSEKVVSEESSFDDAINMSNQTKPSSMGLTFFAKGKVDKIKVRVKAAKYRETTYKDACVKYEGIDYYKNTQIEDYVYREGPFLKLKNTMESRIIRDSITRTEENQEFVNMLYRLSNQCSIDKYRKYSYKRIPLVFPEFIEITLGEKERFSQTEVSILTKDGDYEVNSGIEISLMRREYDNDIFSYTIMLTNSVVSKQKYVLNTLFQSELKVESNDNSELNIIEVPSYGIKGNQVKLDEEEQSLEMLFRNKKNYAMGHGVATGQNINHKDEIKSIYTSFVPSYEVPQLKFEIDEMNELSDKVLVMKNLSDISTYSKAEIIDNLKSFANFYDEWIDSLEMEANTIDERFKEIAFKHIKGCQETYKRICEGIDLIDINDDAYTSFTLMNRSLLMQRVHSGVKERFPDDYDNPIEEKVYTDVPNKDATWRPFQLAFILMSIKSMVDEDSEDRDLVDLIWVPTGGGKTEAYLGISAFTIFYRRIVKKEKGYGTSIMMRYTLRLLAAQQFIRASILICAGEIIRRANSKLLGKEEISIGLWIGSKQTSNTVKKAQEDHKKLTERSTNAMDLKWKKDNHNSFQLLKCPWCGTKMEKEFVTDNKSKKSAIRGAWGYRINRGKVILHCPEQDCDFHQRLPIQIVDEELYKDPPTLLFGTVDKFAAMTWKSEVSRLFALDEGNINCSPDLIIQDELHLISGPLGTIVGLYETAIDAFISNKGVKPKIIASTATIRRAKEQCKMLYARDVRQFPPSGLNSEDSFFTREVSISERPGRLYVGVMPSEKTLVTSEVRLLSAMTQRVNTLDIPEKIKSEYWTTVGYFNSLRELGKASTLVEADIQENNIRIARRSYTNRQNRIIFQKRELTSRLNANDINTTLMDLEVDHSEENKSNKQYAIDLLLASNMISVGVDVSRLNMMMVHGQPKLTSEYIQASSRVGRRYPGIVFTLYSSSRSRDRSHYEKFFPYHQSFYKHVEPTSVTPFSEPARERALHAVVISMMRHIGGLNSEESAQNFDPKSKEFKSVCEYILSRAKKIYNFENEKILESIENDIRSIAYDWTEYKSPAESLEQLTYEKEPKRLLKPYADIEDGTGGFPTLYSMRNVDGQCGVSILEFGDDEDEEF